MQSGSRLPAHTGRVSLQSCAGLLPLPLAPLAASLALCVEVL